MLANALAKHFHIISTNNTMILKSFAESLSLNKTLLKFDYFCEQHYLNYS